MQSTSYNIQSLKSNLLLDSLAFAAIVFTNEGDIVYVNKSAEKLFGNKLNSNEKIHSIFIDKKQFDAINNRINESTTNTRKIALIKKNNYETEVFEVFIQTIIGQAELRLLVLNTINENSKLVLEHITQNLLKETNSLRPYLNKAGKDKLEQIKKTTATNNSLYGIENMRSEIISEERIAELIKLYPQLSPNEIDLCALLTLRLNYKQIALINKKTQIAIRVSVHRMLKKMELNTLNELLSLLYN